MLASLLPAPLPVLRFEIGSRLKAWNSASLLVSFFK